MTDLSQKLKTIHEKAMQADKVLQHSRVENEILRREIKGLKETIELQKSTISDLEEKNKIVKIAEAVTVSKDDKKVIKLKINEFIREIDKCIATLSE